MPINLPDLKPLNLNQFNNGLSIGDGLGDTLPTLLNKLNNNFNIVSDNSREKLTGNRTYYVSNNGLGTNTGLTQIAPLNTLNQVVDIIYNTLDLNGYEITINIEQGLYTNTVVFDGLPLGARTEFPITIVGNPTNENLVKFSYAANINNCCFLIKNKAKVEFKFISFENSLNTTDTCALKVIDSQIKTSNVTYEAFGASCDHILLQQNSVLFYGTHTIKGTNRYHLNVQQSTVLKNSSTSCVWLFQSSNVTALINSLNYSTVILNNNQTTPTLGYSGNSAGSLFYRDFTSTVLFNSNPLGLSSGLVNNVAIEATLSATDMYISRTLSVSNDALFNKDLVVSLNSLIGGNCEITGSLSVNGVTNTNTLNVNANLTTAPATTALFNGAIKVVNNSEFQRATFKDEVLLEKKVTFNQDLIALGAVVVPNGVITKNNLSASGGTGTNGVLNDILISDPSINGGIRWSPRLTVLESNYNTKANLASPQFTGVATVPTPARTSNTTQIANTAYVNDLVTFTANQILEWLTERVPDKLITAWSGNIEDIRAPWVLCDGNNGTPDLRERFIMGAGRQTGTAYCINEVNVPQTSKTIGAQTLNVTSSQVDINLNTSQVSLTRDQMPAHNHFNNLTMVYYGGNSLPIHSGVAASSGGKGGGGTGGSQVIAFLSPVNEQPIGLNQGHSHTVFGKSETHSHSVTIPSSTIDILPPYYVLAYITLKPKVYTFTITT